MKNEEKNGLPEIYRFFKEKFTKEERANPAFIDYKKFSGIIRDFNREIARMIIEEAEEFKMPYRLGSLRIRKFKKKIRLNPDGSIYKGRMIINWVKTRKIWAEQYPDLSEKELKAIHGKQIVYELNEHTEGYMFYLYWNKKGSNAINRSVYSAIFTSVNKRKLARQIKGDNKIDYYE